MENKFVLNDGTLISNNYDLELYLTSLGFSLGDLYVSVGEIQKEDCGFGYDLQCARDKADEYERVADGLYGDLNSLVNQIDNAVDKLLSGKSGKGYTKNDIAAYLKSAVRELECI